MHCPQCIIFIYYNNIFKNIQKDVVILLTLHLHALKWDPQDCTRSIGPLQAQCFDSRATWVFGEECVPDALEKSLLAPPESDSNQQYD
jgi:hypothetical protein